MAESRATSGPPESWDSRRQLYISPPSTARNDNSRRKLSPSRAETVVGQSRTPHPSRVRARVCPAPATLQRSRTPRRSGVAGPGELARRRGSHSRRLSRVKPPRATSGDFSFELAEPMSSCLPRDSSGGDTAAVSVDVALTSFRPLAECPPTRSAGWCSLSGSRPSMSGEGSVCAGALSGGAMPARLLPAGLQWLRPLAALAGHTCSGLTESPATSNGSDTRSAIRCLCRLAGCCRDWCAQRGPRFLALGLRWRMAVGAAFVTMSDDGRALGVEPCGRDRSRG